MTGTGTCPPQPSPYRANEQIAPRVSCHVLCYRQETGLRTGECAENGLYRSDIGMRFLDRRQRDRYSPKVINEIEGGIEVTYQELENEGSKANSPEEARALAENQ